MKKKRLIVLMALCGVALAAFPRPAPGGEVRHHIKGTTFAAEVQQRMSGMKLKLNNHHSQTSFVEVGGFQLRFDIPRTTVDIDCGTLCPDLGDGHFYINDVNLQRASLSFSGSDSLSLSPLRARAGRSRATTTSWATTLCPTSSSTTCA